MFGLGGGRVQSVLGFRKGVQALGLGKPVCEHRVRGFYGKVIVSWDVGLLEFEMIFFVCGFFCVWCCGGLGQVWPSVADSRTGFGFCTIADLTDNRMGRPVFVSGRLYSWCARDARERVGRVRRFPGLRGFRVRLFTEVSFVAEITL